MGKALYPSSVSNSIVPLETESNVVKRNSSSSAEKSYPCATIVCILSHEHRHATTNMVNLSQLPEMSTCSSRLRALLPWKIQVWSRRKQLEISKYSSSLALLTICCIWLFVTSVDDNVRRVKFANSFSGTNRYKSPVPPRSSSNNSAFRRNGPLNTIVHHLKQTLDMLSNSSVSSRLNTWNKTREGISLLWLR